LAIELDAIRGREGEATDGTATILLREEAPALSGSHTDGGARVLRPVRLAEDAARDCRLGAALALAPGAPPEAVVQLVEGDPLAVLPGLALAGRKDGQAGRAPGGLIPSAVVGDPDLEVLGAESGASLGRHRWRRRL